MSSPGRGRATTGHQVNVVIGTLAVQDRKLPAELDDPAVALTPRLIVDIIKGVASHFFPLLADETNDVD